MFRSYLHWYPEICSFLLNTSRLSKGVGKKYLVGFAHIPWMFFHWHQILLISIWHFWWIGWHLLYNFCLACSLHKSKSLFHVFFWEIIQIDHVGEIKDKKKLNNILLEELLTQWFSTQIYLPGTWRHTLWTPNPMKTRPQDPRKNRTLRKNWTFKKDRS